jgi:hypothetical protein
MAKHIMDVSRWQGRINWGKVKASGLVSGVMQKTRRTLRKLHCKEDIMASTTYEQKRFCEIKRCGEIDHLGNVPVMVRNAGQLPQPFWLGAACGGGSCSLSASVARA